LQLPSLCLPHYTQLFLSDPEAKFSKSIGWADNASGRTGRYAIVIDHGKIKYADIETEKGAVKVRPTQIRWGDEMANEENYRNRVPTLSLPPCK